MSSSEMVSVPREEIELTVHCLRMAGETSSADELEAYLDQPSEQHLGEPVAPADPGEAERLRGLAEKGERLAAMLPAIKQANETLRTQLAERDARDYAIEHAGYLADAAEQVLADYQAYTLAQMLKSEGGDDADSELEDAVDSARDELHESLENLRSMTHEFRKRRSHAGHAVSEDPGAPADLDPRECRKCGSLTADECKAGGCWFERNPSEKACGYSLGDWECRPGGYLYDAGTGEGYDPQDCSHICPCCRTKDYLEAAKEDAESTSKYSNNFDSGTGLDIWKSAERVALKANHPAAVKALAEIGPVEALDDETVVVCNSQGAPVGEVEP